MIGLTNSQSNGAPLVAPNLNRRRALLVLDKIDEILAWEQGKETERDERFVELGQYVCETRVFDWSLRPRIAANAHRSA